METKKGQFYIGRDSGSDEPVIYKADNLTTHGVIVGMTGSGKTGLGVNILEEALHSGIPTLVLDPKGDMGNLILNFPENRPEDFLPWMDEAKAERKGLTLAQLAAEEAEERSLELAADGISSDRVSRLKEETQFTIYTPGSSAGVGLNVLGKLGAPDLDWDSGAEIIRDEIEGLVSSVLLLAGIQSDPVSGPEHILLSTIVETWWRQGRDLDLATLVGQIPKPPFRKLGVFDLDTFMPEKKRMDLALRLNGLLASPSFAGWLQGEPLDVETLIGGGPKTKCAIVYLAHLSDEERQFIVALILSKLVTWIRSQPGSSELRALVYLDEAFGYAPPVAEPPTKKPIMTILKQARAFGVGMVLVTQNPVDLDYKAMSNAGTWVVGRLQTETDKKRIVEGMQALASDSGVADLDTQISALEKRQFILHQAKKQDPKVFKRRESMCFRYGPFTRDQVSGLMERFKPATPAEATPPAISEQAEPPAEDSSPVAPAVAENIEVSYLDPAAPWSSKVGADPTGSHYAAGAAVTVQLLYDDTRAGVNHSDTYEAMVFPLADVIDPAHVVSVDHDDRDFEPSPREGASYQLPDVKVQNKTFWSGFGSDLKNHLVANEKLDVWSCPPLKLYSRVGESEDEFRERCRSTAAEAADAAVAKLTDRFRARIDRVRDQVSAADTRVRELEGAAQAKQQDELMSGAGDLLGALLGGRKSSNPLGKAASRRAATQKAEARAEAAAAKLDQKQAELIELEDELADALVEITAEHEANAEKIEPVEIGLEKTDVRVAATRLVWVPVG